MSYNGYSNYETWNICLWIDNEYGSHEYWREAAAGIAEEIRDEEFDDADEAKSEAITRLANRMKDDFESDMPDVPGFWSDILRSAFSRIDWHEAAETRFDDDETFVAAEDEEEEEEEEEED